MDGTQGSPALQDLIERLRLARASAADDPFGDPVLLLALAISRRLDDGALDLQAVESMVQSLADDAAARRAQRLAAYLGHTPGQDPAAALNRLAERIIRPDPRDSPIPFAAFRQAVERTRFAAVFTAHPTFSLPAASGALLAEAASSGQAPPRGMAHRPEAPDLQAEFDQVVQAITRGRDALDAFNGALLEAARRSWPDRWMAVAPRPLILTSWVGYDTDGRTDIGWWTTLRLRLVMKRLQYKRLLGQVGAAPALAARLAEAEAAVATQIEAVPEKPEPAAIQALAAALIGGREAAMTTPDALLPLFDAAIAAAEPEAKLPLCVARAGLLGHGLSLAHTHFRLNSAQLHNAVRPRLGLTASPDDMAQRRGLLAQINEALDDVTPRPVDFGALLAEQASAAKLLMVIAQIAKHVDAATPIRFLIAETETGYTLLAALWLARHFGIDRAIEISPLFETAEALERGERVLEEALRSPHWREYLQQQGRLCLQFGYSDSGRYVGQLPASYLIEKLKLRLAEMLARHGLAGVEVVLFDTHGESIGRGGHPASLGDRMDYLFPPTVRRALAAAGVQVREESSFQGGDGYLLFGTQELATATVARVAEHAFSAPPGGDAKLASPGGDPKLASPGGDPKLASPGGDDPIYAEADYGTDFFATIKREMQVLVEDPGYAALLGGFGPGLLERTGSRPSARQSDGMGGPVRLTHPSQLRAIPNNAILHQVGWLANTLHGLGAAAAANPDAFADLRERSPRFARAMAMAERAAQSSDIGVVRAVIGTLDPGTWLDRAAATQREGRRAALIKVATVLQAQELEAPLRRLYRRLRTDELALRATWPDLPTMPERLVLLHGLRLALIHRLWLLAVGLPEFSPRHGTSQPAVIARIFALDVEPALDLLAQVFPASPDPGAALDFGEPSGGEAVPSYGREHAELFAPMRRIFGLVRFCSAAVSHEVGAFG